MQALDLVDPVAHALEHVVEPVFLDDFARGAEEKERVGRDVVVNLPVGQSASAEKREVKKGQAHVDSDDVAAVQFYCSSLDHCILMTTAEVMSLPSRKSVRVMTCRQRCYVAILSNAKHKRTSAERRGLT